MVWTASGQMFLSTYYQDTGSLIPMTCNMTELPILTDIKNFTFYLDVANQSELWCSYFGDFAMRCDQESSFMSDYNSSKLNDTTELLKNMYYLAFAG